MSTLTRRDWLKITAVAPAAAAATGGLLPRLSLAAPSADDLKAVIDKAVKFLASRQKDDGDLAPDPRVGPGLTALAVSALIRNGYGTDTPVVAKGLGFLEKNVHPDGGVYSQGLATYTTSLAIVAFKEANAGGKYDKVIDAATKFVKGLQYGDGTSAPIDACCSTATGIWAKFSFEVPAHTKFVVVVSGEEAPRAEVPADRSVLYFPYSLGVTNCNGHSEDAGGGGTTEPDAGTTSDDGGGTGKTW